MADQKVTMILKVDLQCPCCYRKVKKLLCKFRQIRDQLYDEKHNTVTITVVCCNPEKIRDKLCCKGGKTILSIEIKEPPKPKQPEKPKEPPTPKKPATEVVAVVPKPDPPTPKKPKKPEGAKEVVVVVPKPDPPKPPPKAPEPVPGYPHRGCCGPCSQGYGGGPCWYGRPPPCFEEYGRPPPPPPCYGRPIYDSYGGRGPCYMARCDYYICEEYPSACTIM